MPKGIHKSADLILRIGLAFAFLYPPIDAIFDPLSWIGYFPSFVRGYLPDIALLHGFGFFEVVIALWLLSGWRIFWPSLAAAAALFAIVIFNHAQFEVVFRDLSIMSIAIALALSRCPRAYGAAG